MSEAVHQPLGRSERSLRIALVVHQYPPDHVGGTEIHTQTLARTLTERGHAVAVAALSFAIGFVVREVFGVEI